MIGRKFIMVYEVIAKAHVGELTPEGEPITGDTLWWAEPFPSVNAGQKILVCSPAYAFPLEPDQANKEAEEYLKRHGWERYSLSQLCQRFTPTTDIHKGFSLGELLAGVHTDEMVKRIKGAK